MQGSYDLLLVASSMVVAVLASYVAIEFAGRLRESERWMAWLTAGAISMGSGVWSMHFVGMSAFQLPIVISYDLPMTFGTWVAAVAVSALALFLVGRARLTTRNVTFGAFAMGFGICVMHYGGMWAMRMSPGISYDPTWFGISVAIAVGASAAALLIVSQLRTVRSWRDIGLRGGAALLMGAAISGMHYSGMQAAQFSADAFCYTGNALSGAWMTAPVLIAALIGLPIALAFAIADAREVVKARRAEREQAQRVEEMAFVDRETSLPNRHRLTRQLTDSLLQGRSQVSLVCLRLRSAAGQTRSSDTVLVARALRAHCEEPHLLARTASDQFSILLTGVERPVAWTTALRAKVRSELLSTGLALDAGVAVAPKDGDTAQMLMMRAASRSAQDAQAANSPEAGETIALAS